MKYTNHVTPSCSLSSPTLWNLSGLIFSPDIGFFSRSPTQTRVCFTSNKCYFIYHVNTFLITCKSNGKHLVISLLYHTCISSILSPLPYNITYLSWLATSYGCPSFTMSMWSYHWWSRYPFASMPLWEWTYNSSKYISKYYYDYYFGEWSTCLEGLSPFPLPHPTMSEYLYHQKRFSDLVGHHHCWPDLHKYGAANIDNDNTCNDDGCLGEDTII